MAQIQNVFNETLGSTKSSSRMNDGEIRTVRVFGLDRITGIVRNFSEDLPKELCWKEYDSLSPEDREFVDLLEADVNEDGKPRSKFVEKYYVRMADVDTGFKFQFDVSIMVSSSGMPWRASKELLERVGPKFIKGTSIGTYFPLNGTFRAQIKVKANGYPMLLSETLERVPE